MLDGTDTGDPEGPGLAAESMPAGVGSSYAQRKSNLEAAGSRRQEVTR